jgi:hypothetical protein
MGAFQLQALGEHLDDDGGRRHGQCAAQRERGLPAHLQVGRQLERQEPAEGHRGDNGQHHLGHAQAEHDAPHRLQAGQRKFEPDREHQEHDPQFGQGVGGGAVFGHAQRMGPDHDAHGKVAEHRRQVQHAEGDHAQHGTAKQEEGQFKAGKHALP